MKKLLILSIVGLLFSVASFAYIRLTEQPICLNPRYIEDARIIICETP